jgi:hypothetical protein
MPMGSIVRPPRLQHPLIREPSSAMLFVMTRALAGVVRAAAVEESPLLGTEALEDELVSYAGACSGLHPLDARRGQASDALRPRTTRHVDHCAACARISVACVSGSAVCQVR